MKQKYTAISPYSALIVAVLLFLSSCSKNKEVTSNIPNLSTSEIKKSLEENRLDYQWFGAKIASEVQFKEQKRSFKTNLRLRRDSAIWMSISPALGIEVARVLITQDSIKFIDKWNDQYFIGDYSFMKEKLNIDIEFDILQDMIVGDPMLYTGQERFKSNKEDNAYLLTSKNKGRVRRAAGVRYNGKEEQTLDSLTFDVDESTYQRITRNAQDEGDLIIKRYWVEADTWKTVRSIITDLGSKRSIETHITEHTEHDGKRVPKKMTFTLTDLTEVSTFKMDYSRLKINQHFTFPFQIPEKFERIN